MKYSTYVGILTVVCAALTLLLFKQVGVFLDLPIVAMDQNGDCQWVRTLPDYEKVTCPMVLPDKYDVEHVYSK